MNTPRPCRRFLCRNSCNPRRAGSGAARPVFGFCAARPCRRGAFSGARLTPARADGFSTPHATSINGRASCSASLTIWKRLRASHYKTSLQPTCARPENYCRVICCALCLNLFRAFACRFALEIDIASRCRLTGEPSRRWERRKATTGGNDERPLGLFAFAAGRRLFCGRCSAIPTGAPPHDPANP